MIRTHDSHWVRIALVFSLGLLACLSAPAQDQRGQRRDSRERVDERERDAAEPEGRRRRGVFDFADTDTSENNERLKRVLERFPSADKDKDGVLTAQEARAFMEEQRRRWRDRRRGRERFEPTHNDIAYGPEDDHVIDLYLAESDTPTPLVVFFHGGQFITGDEGDLGTLDVRALVAAGISVASIDYRDTSTLPFPACFEDAARAVQFLRFYAQEINADPTRIASHGEEAGGNIALFLALHDDLAKSKRETSRDWNRLTDQPSEEDTPALPSILPTKHGEGTSGDAVEQTGPEPWENPLIETMSTRLFCAIARHPIASFDSRDWIRHKIPMNKHERLFMRYLDVRYLDPIDDDDVDALVKAVSPLSLASADDPEVILISQYWDEELADDASWTVVRHHPIQIKLIAEALQAKGVRATIRYRGMKNDQGTSSVQFLTQMLK